MVTSTKLQGVRGDNGWKDVLDVLPVRTIIRGQDVESVVSVHASKNVRFLDETNPCTLLKSS